jgi:hypothetical protein
MPERGRGHIVAFFATALVRSKMYINLPSKIPSKKPISSAISVIERDAKKLDIYPCTFKEHFY